MEILVYKMFTKDLKERFMALSRKDRDFVIREAERENNRKVSSSIATDDMSYFPTAETMLLDIEALITVCERRKT